MKADFTRDTFAPEKRYNRVVQQQGRVPLDADWNEQTAIQEHHDEVEAVDVIGQAGFPQGPSFHLSASPDGLDLFVGDGNAYVDGVLAENRNGSVEVLAFQAPNQVQLRTLILDGVPLRAGEWVNANVGAAQPWFRIQTVDPLKQTLTLMPNLPSTLPPIGTGVWVKRVASYIIQPDWYFPDFVTFGAAPALPALDTNATFLAYLDVWHRHVTALEDPLLREVALGGSDTCTRQKTVWQVKLLPGDEGQTIDCSTPLPTEVSTGRIAARARMPSTGDTPCVVSPTARYRSLENQLYRVEIHDPGTVGTATFKFSRDNGMVMVSWLTQTGTDLVVSSLGRDKVLGFASGQWIELVDDTVDESQAPGTLVKIKKVNPATNTITIDDTTVYPSTGRGYDITKFPRNPRVRRWDHVSSVAALTVVRPAGDGFVDLEQGVQVRFEDGNYVSGDYWLIPARTITADVEWPRNEVNDPIPQARHGIKHHFARLGVVTIAGGKITSVSDCRPQFPPLTNLPAEGDGCCCGVTIKPGDDPQRAIDTAIAKAGTQKIEGLNIEFAAGTFQLGAPIRISAPELGHGNLVVRGCGGTTRLIAAQQENVLRIVGWKSATVVDMYAEAGVTDQGAGQRQRPDVEPPSEADLNRHLLGVVCIRNCGSARAERLELKCASGPRRQASCLSVWNDERGFVRSQGYNSDLVGASWIRDCRLEVGHLQVGALLVNQMRATVADNLITSYQPSRDSIGAITTSREYLSLYRKLVIRDLQLTLAGSESPQPIVAGLTNHTLVLGRTQISFRADTMLGSAWQGVFQSEAKRVFPFLFNRQPVPETPGRSKASPGKSGAPVRSKATSSIGKHTEPSSTRLVMALDLQKATYKVRNRIQKMAQTILAAAAGLPNVKTTLTEDQLQPFKKWLVTRQASLISVASAGIVIGGSSGGDLRVINNTVAGALDGIHLGFSHSDGPDDPADQAVRIQVEGNSVVVQIPREIQRGFHRGVFVGNGRSITVCRNLVVVRTAAVGENAAPTVDGISVNGVDGPVVQVTDNDVQGATVGIRTELTRDPQNPSGDMQWRVANNATFGCSTNRVTIPVPGVVETGNTPP